jgi:hypothetical protein
MNANKVDRIISEIGEAAWNAEKNMIAVTSAKDTVFRLMERVDGYKPRIEASIADGVFPEASKAAMDVVFADLRALVEAHRRALVQLQAQQGPLAAGLRRAQAIAARIQADTAVAPAQAPAPAPAEAQGLARPVSPAVGHACADTDTCGGSHGSDA